MTRQPEMWTAIKSNMPRGQWVQLQDLYKLIGRFVNLDEEDHEPQSPTSDLPKWKRNVRNIVQYRKGTGEIEWDGSARYRLM